MTETPFTAVTFDALSLAPAPIRPEWIRGGAPSARLHEIARSADGTSVTVAWDCTRGTFDWIFGVDETVYIVEGEVTVSQDGRPTAVLKAGDAAFFPCGSATVWHVDRYVRKIAVCRHAMPAPLGFALRAWTRLAAVLRRRTAPGTGFAASQTREA
jgi:uncharacterized cupin superfamily protein